MIFKSWKSLLNIDILKGTRKERIQCFVYARLLSILLITNIYSYAHIYTQYNYKKETSLHKVINWLLSNNRIQNILKKPEELLTKLEKALPRLCKQKRKRKTTWELIEDEIDYLTTLEEKLASPVQA